MIYEILYIIPSKFSDTEVNDVQGRVNAILEKNEGEIKKSENLGKIKLAYPIKKERYGTYVLTYIEIPGENLQKLEQDLKLEDSVLRHVVVKREDGIPEATFAINAYQAPLTPEGKRAEKRPVREVVKPKPAAPAEKISEEELDKKLDEILESDIVSGV